MIFFFFVGVCPPTASVIRGFLMRNFIVINFKHNLFYHNINILITTILLP